MWPEHSRLVASIRASNKMLPPQELPRSRVPISRSDCRSLVQGVTAQRGCIRFSVPKSDQAFSLHLLILVDSLRMMPIRQNPASRRHNSGNSQHYWDVRSSTVVSVKLKKIVNTM